MFLSSYVHYLTHYDCYVERSINFYLNNSLGVSLDHFLLFEMKADEDAKQLPPGALLWKDRLLLQLGGLGSKARRVGGFSLPHYLCDRGLVIMG